ncbi:MULTISPECIES: hypothetical protein [Arthrobacter]|uniref:Uncharacterized protein n=1 Tax=Arthrobacter jinronghuae TaxID=2964609 RepID=A0ABT1NTC3_9MICC|nr:MULTISPECIES: hypothetical protein [Arthrobacter]MCQ1950938.1 hypothetical protein [Arthrobacter jinronghuae]MCQ1954251.1 hypothetical protein [Arthrobacter sp. zg-Y238]MCQ1957127.1 hypothetical protein [Arthrobacter jinronghuae]UWX79402.1 hypothetical protein N2K98_04095 [Arthrobacter jinronghuae]
MTDGTQHQTKTLPAPDSRHPAPSDEQKRNAFQYVVLFWLLMFATLLSSNLVLPWKLIPLALGIAALVVGIIAVIKLARRRMGPLMPILVSLSLVITALTTLGLAGMTLLWDETMTYESCMRSALTLDGVEACEAEYLPFQQIR